MRMNANKAPFSNHAYTRAIVRGGRIHSDIKVLSVRSKENYRYAICFVDDLTRRGISYPMRTTRHKGALLAQ